MSIAALSSAAQSSLIGLSNVSREVEEVAADVARGISSEPDSSFSQSLDAIRRLPELRQQALANVSLFSAVEDLFAEMASLPRL